MVLKSQQGLLHLLCRNTNLPILNKYFKLKGLHVLENTLASI